MLGYEGLLNRFSKEINMIWKTLIKRNDNKASTTATAVRKKKPQ